MNCRQLVIFGLGVSCLQLYIQNNWVGPPTAADPNSLLPSCCEPFTQVSLTCVGLQDRTNDMKPYNFSCPVFVTVCVPINSIALYSMYTYWCRSLLKLHNVCVFLFVLQPVAQLVCNVWNGLQVHSWSRGLRQIHNVMMCPDVVDLLWTVQEIHKLMKVSR